MLPVSSGVFAANCGSKMPHMQARALHMAFKDEAVQTAIQGRDLVLCFFLQNETGRNDFARYKEALEGLGSVDEDEAAQLYMEGMSDGVSDARVLRDTTVVGVSDAQVLRDTTVVASAEDGIVSPGEESSRRQQAPTHLASGAGGAPRGANLAPSPEEQEELREMITRDEELLGVEIDLERTKQFTAESGETPVQFSEAPVVLAAPVDVTHDHPSAASEEVEEKSADRVVESEMEIPAVRVITMNDLVDDDEPMPVDYTAEEQTKDVVAALTYAAAVPETSILAEDDRSANAAGVSAASRAISPVTIASHPSGLEPSLRAVPLPSLVLTAASGAAADRPETPPLSGGVSGRPAAASTPPAPPTPATPATTLWPPTPPKVFRLLQDGSGVSSVVLKPPSPPQQVWRPLRHDSVVYSGFAVNKPPSPPQVWRPLPVQSQNGITSVATILTSGVGPTPRQQVPTPRQQVQPTPRQQAPTPRHQEVVPAAGHGLPPGAGPPASDAWTRTAIPAARHGLPPGAGPPASDAWTRTAIPGSDAWTRFQAPVRDVTSHVTSTVGGLAGPTARVFPGGPVMRNINPLRNRPAYAGVRTNGPAAEPIARAPPSSAFPPTAARSIVPTSLFSDRPAAITPARNMVVGPPRTNTAGRRYMAVYRA